MITWVKPNGSEITTNDLKETVEHCEAVGFKRKRKRRTRAEMEIARNGYRSNSNKTNFK
jgi:hypothetical protein